MIERRCKDCRWCKRPWVARLFLSWETSLCLHPEMVKEVDRVTGKNVQHYCAAARIRSCNCGPSARLFEPRPKKWWRRWLCTRGGNAARKTTKNDTETGENNRRG